jgi:capsular polysaccharide transport system permease protein
MNEQRIRNWQERRKVAAGDVAVDFAPVERQQPAEPGGSPEMPFGADRLEQARAAILERKAQRWRKTLRRLALFVAAPVLALLLYVGLIATPLYEGEAVFTVQTSASSAAAPNAGLFGVAGNSSTIADAFKARSFILSRPMMEHMQKEHRFLDHFAGSNMDPLTRYDGPIGLNRDPFNYYLKRVKVSVDVQEGILRLYVQARTQEDAVRFGNAILAAAERHVNAASDKIGNDQIEALTRDVQRAEMQVANTRRSLASVQARRGELSPEQAASAIYQLISNLELQLSEARRQRDSLRAEGLVDSPLLPSLDQRVRELQSQIAEQRGRLVNPAGGALSATLNEYEGAASKKEIAQARWQSSLNILQQAYLDVLQQRRYFVLVVGMSAGAFAKVRDYGAIAWPLLLLLALGYAAWFGARRMQRRGHA